MLSYLTQLGAPVRVYWAGVGVGVVAPATVTWNWPDWPVAMVELFALVIVGATRAVASVTENDCVALV